MFAIFGMPTGAEWIVIGAAILLFFGGKKIPEMMKGIGSGIKEFKKASKLEPNENQDKLKE